MLSRLYIRNYAIIREVNISFTQGLNIITGETGAGKSILMGALNLVLGERADKHVLYDAEQKCIVEATFADIKGKINLQDIEQEEWDWDEEIIIRRELQANGKSRSFINDTPVTLSALKKLGSWLVDLHQQFDTSELTAENFQTDVLDAMAGTSADAQRMQAAYREYAQIKSDLEQMEKEQSDAISKQDYQQFLFDELNALQLRDNELEELEQEWKSLSHADQIRLALSQVMDMLDAGESPVVQQVKLVIQKIEGIQHFRNNLQDLLPRLQSSLIELKDIAAELSAEHDHVQSDPERMAAIEERLHQINKLIKKHHVQTTADLMKIHQALSDELQKFNNKAEDIQNLRAKVQQQEKQCMAIAEDLSKKRKKIIPPVEKSVNQLLKQLGMPNALITVQMDAHGLRASGTDRIQILFDANKSGRFESLGQVASGGELSRLMLSVKSLVAGKMQLPTLIFDEIDTGISGEAARQVGLLMRTMADRHQIMCITHQPQIAAKAHSHFFIYKEEKKGNIQTAVRQLAEEERVEVIAQMMSGEKPTTAAIHNAREMVTGKDEVIVAIKK
jgi:DNA repair protein RecN (Recombination protein N)